MKKITSLLLGLLVLAGPMWSRDIAKMRNLGYVVVSPNGPEDGGDFGPKTPGTRTSGMQEAFDFAKDNKREVYIVGGAVDSSSAPVYNLSTTLHIPWGEQMHCDGGNYVMNFTMTEGVCLHVDSMMSSDLKFGSIVARSLKSGTVVSCKPESTGPDGFCAFGVRTIQFDSIVGGGGKYKKGGGVGLLVDSSFGCVAGGQFLVGRIEDCDKGIVLDQSKVSGQGIVGIVVECPRIHNCRTSIEVNTGYFNRIDALLDSGDDINAGIGANILGGFQNVYTLAWQGGFASGKALVFDGDSHDNLVCAMNPRADGITNKAGTPTNRIQALKPVGFGVSTPPLPASGAAVLNREPYTIEATILTPGLVSSWKVADSDGASRDVQSGLMAGQSILLKPGDRIAFAYSQPPTWVWRALR